MQYLLVLIGLFLGFNFHPFDDFKSQQKQYARVRTAYQEKEKGLLAEIAKKGIKRAELEICLIAFKEEEELQLWAKNKNQSSYQLIKTFPFCAGSGILGPKRKQGDRQIPEGFYNIDRFNPASSFYLSLGINYPNAADKIRCGTNDPGGDIFMHGDCVSIGCISITDDKIKELYLYAIEARNNGQNNIPVGIFPCKLTTSNYQKLKTEYASNPSLLTFWANLKQGFDAFQETKKIPKYTVSTEGKYIY